MANYVSAVSLKRKFEHAPIAIPRRKANERDGERPFSHSLPTQLSDILPEDPFSLSDPWCVQGFQTISTMQTQAQAWRHTQFVWEFEREDGRWMLYAPEELNILEPALKLKQPTVALNVHTTVWLEKMVENNGLTGFIRRVRRRDLSEGCTPPLCIPSFCEPCRKETTGQKFCGDCGERKGCLPPFKNMNHVSKACRYVVDAGRSELEMRFSEDKELRRFVLTSQTVTKNKKRLGLKTIEKNLRVWRAAQNRLDNDDLIDFPHKFNVAADGFDAVLACRDRKTIKKGLSDACTQPSDEAPTLAVQNGPVEPQFFFESSDFEGSDEEEAQSDIEAFDTRLTSGSPVPACVPAPVPNLVPASVAMDETWFSDLVTMTTSSFGQVKSNLTKEEARQELVPSLEDYIMVSSTSSTSSTASNYIKECVECMEDTVGERYCDKCGKKKDVCTLLSTPSVSTPSMGTPLVTHGKPPHKHAAFFEYLKRTKRTPQSIKDSYNLAGYTARAEWYNTGNKAGSIVSFWRHQPDMHSTSLERVKIMLSDLIHWLKEMPPHEFRALWPDLVVDQQNVQGCVEGPNAMGCYVHHVTFRVVKIGYDLADESNSSQLEYLETYMRQRVPQLYLELQTQLERVLESLLHTATPFAHPPPPSSPHTTTDPPPSANTASSFASSHPPPTSVVTQTHATTMVDASGLLSSGPCPPFELWDRQSLPNHIHHPTLPQILPQTLQIPQQLQPPEIPSANCELCSKYTVGHNYCDTCGFAKGQAVKFDNQRHVRVACKYLGDLFKKGENPQFDGVLLRTLMNASKDCANPVAADTLLKRLREYRHRQGDKTPVGRAFNIPANGLEVVRAYHAHLQDEQNQDVRTTTVNPQRSPTQESTEVNHFSSC
eukprot:m.97670 g.97670  ORF g.97670 m.97670 type:complete len:883 (+) comp27000_c0_seq1:322-2970(+)